VTRAPRLKSPRRSVYPAAMRSVLRSSLGKVAQRLAARPALVTVAALALVGCDNGGLLVVEQKPPPVVQGPSVNDMVSGGTYASNSKYRLFYTNGQPTPNQGVSTSDSNRLNGGLVGAAHGD
jgi:hypothetical protein